MKKKNEFWGIFAPFLLETKLSTNKFDPCDRVNINFQCNCQNSSNVNVQVNDITAQHTNIRFLLRFPRYHFCITWLVCKVFLAQFFDQTHHSMSTKATRYKPHYINWFQFNVFYRDFHSTWYIFRLKNLFHWVFMCKTSI